MTKRYCGNVVFSITYLDSEHYKIKVSVNGKHKDTFFYREPMPRKKSGDSPEMFDQIGADAAASVVHGGDDEIVGHMNLNRNGVPVVSRTKGGSEIRGSHNRSVGSGGKTLLDKILDSVSPQHEVTIDAEGYSQEDVDRIYRAAKARGLNVGGTNRWILIRDSQDRRHPLWPKLARQMERKPAGRIEVVWMLETHRNSGWKKLKESVYSGKYSDHRDEIDRITKKLAAQHAVAQIMEY